MADVVTDNVYKIEVKRKKTKAGLFGTVIRFFIGLAGVITAMIGVLLCVTIIGIPFGIGLIGIGGGMFLGAFRRQSVHCPACDKKINVLVDAEDFECPRCKKSTIIEWTE